MSKHLDGPEDRGPADDAGQRRSAPAQPAALAARAAPMTPQQIEACVDAAAAALALPIAPEHRAGVLRYFALAAGFAAQLDEVPLAPHDEPAVSFVPVA